MDLPSRLRSLLKSRRSTHDLIFDHYRRFWGRNRVEDVHWTPGPMAAGLPDFHIAEVRPMTATDMWTFATVGAWRGTEHDDHGLEFVAVSRSESPVVMQKLAMVAYYHAGGGADRLGAGHLMPIGEFWIEGSTLDALLLSLPYLWGPKLEHCELSDRHIQVVWVLPITSAERAFAREHGVEALEQRFEEAAIDYLDPFRESVL